MKNYFRNFRNWCNANQGLLTFYAIIISIIVLIPFQKWNLTFASPFFEKIINILSFKIFIPLYILLLLSFVLFFYFGRIKRRYRNKIITEEFIVGNWKNEWKHSSGKWHSETFEITEDFKYMVSGEHRFNISNFRFDFMKNKIKFDKIAVRENDNRKLSNVLTIKNNDFLIGLEGNTEIKYSRI